MTITGSLQEKNGRYYTVCNVPDETGKIKKVWRATGLTIKGNKREAVKVLNERLAELNRTRQPYTKITVADYFRQWLQQIEKEVRPNTYRNYHGNMINHIIPYFDEKKIRLQELKPYQLEEFYQCKLQSNSKLESDESLSATTIKHFHQNISKALSDALRRGLITTNPAAAARTPKAEKYHAEYLDGDQVKELLQIFKGTVIELPVLLCAIYGLRRSEALGLKWSHVDFSRRTITIAETLQQHTGGNYTDKPKTESSYRTLPMLDTVFVKLEEQKRQQEEHALLMGECYHQSDFVCTWATGEVITPNYLSKNFHAIISKSSLPKIRLHDLRHSVASNLLAAGMSVVDVQEWLGHANASTTLDVYSHADKDAKQRISNVISYGILGQD